MGDSFSSLSTANNTNFLAQYTIIQQLQSQHVKFLQHNQTQQQYMLRQFVFSSMNQCTKLLDKLEKIKQKLNGNQHIIELKEYLFQKNSQFYFSSLYRVYALWEYPQRTLDDQIQDRRFHGNVFQEVELWSILANCIVGLSTFQQLGIKHQSLKSRAILLKKDGTIKISDPWCLGLASNYQQIITKSGRTKTKHIYLSPQQCKGLKEQLIVPNYNSYKSDVFVTGMVMLQAALLDYQDRCYQQYFNLNWDTIDYHLNLVAEKYSRDLEQVIRFMLQQRQQYRPDWLFLKSYVAKEQNTYHGDYHSQDNQLQRQNQSQQYQQQTQSKILIDNNINNGNSLKNINKTSANHEFPVNNPYINNFYKSQPQIINTPEIIAKNVLLNGVRRESHARQLPVTVGCLPPSPPHVPTLIPKTVSPFLMNNTFGTPQKVDGNINSDMRICGYPSVISSNANIVSNSSIPHSSINSAAQPRIVLYPPSPVVHTYPYINNNPSINTIYTNVSTNQINDQKNNNDEHILVQQNSSTNNNIMKNLQLTRKRSSHRSQHSKNSKNIDNKLPYHQDNKKNVQIGSQQTRLYKTTTTNQIIPQRVLIEDKTMIVSPERSYKNQEQPTQPSPINTNNYPIYQNVQITSMSKQPYLSIEEQYNNINRNIGDHKINEMQYLGNANNLSKSMGSNTSLKVASSSSHSHRPFIRNEDKQNINIPNQLIKINPLIQHSSANNYIQSSLAPVQQKRFLACTSPVVFEPTYEITQHYPTGQIYYSGHRSKMNNTKHGFGILYYQDGGKYEGFWYHDLMQGQGKLYYQSGKLAYQGNFYQGMFNGTGVLYNQSSLPSNIQVSFNYTDMNQQLNQQQEQTQQGHNHQHKNGKWVKFQGQFLNDKKHGRGSLYICNGDKFDGYFKENCAEGPGTYTFKNGGSISGIWRENVKVV